MSTTTTRQLTVTATVLEAICRGEMFLARARDQEERNRPDKEFDETRYAALIADYSLAFRAWEAAKDLVAFLDSEDYAQLKARGHGYEEALAHVERINLLRRQANLCHTFNLELK